MTAAAAWSAALLEATADRIGATPRRPGDLELAAAVLLAHQLLGAVPVVVWPAATALAAHTDNRGAAPWTDDTSTR